MSAAHTIARNALFYLVLLLIPADALADPFIFGSAGIGAGLAQCGGCLPLSDLSFSVETTTSFFLTASTTGGGSVQITAPQVTFDPNTGSLDFGGGHFDITTIGPGTASAHFGESFSLNITNTGSSSGRIVYPELSLGFSGGYVAHPDQGQSLFVSASISFDGAIYRQAADCSAQSRSYDCNNFFDHTVDFLYRAIDPRQTISLVITEDVNASVAEVPEPSALLLLLTMLGLGSYPFLNRRHS